MIGSVQFIYWHNCLQIKQTTSIVIFEVYFRTFHLDILASTLKFSWRRVYNIVNFQINVMEHVALKIAKQAIVYVIIFYQNSESESESKLTCSKKLKSSWKVFYQKYKQ